MCSKERVLDTNPSLNTGRRCAAQTMVSRWMIVVRGLLHLSPIHNTYHASSANSAMHKNQCMRAQGYLTYLLGKREEQRDTSNVETMHSGSIWIGLDKNASYRAGLSSKCQLREPLIDIHNSGDIARE